ncbi:4-hydroxy-tetrahydrodipicolinate reductase [Pseudoflavonifractor phocaeensis]|uniref:4-hydroxy-tetrahydrodipicolinate reductase n=1 Tax=Pseudoflavonifractor phocaeensis TaxID=1870988 RepID=UPI001F256EB8|nr:4-hydroxy-tetrahydrodipicolinate reductase [Pseudoflavonifractor phocaeensis]MCF2595906.1 4-hydroxy-tetrahydrodipicolinate reductase [Pseudoflavonifractor phocaeensis]
MLKIIISGCNGHMGRVVASLCAADPQVEVVAGFDVMGSTDREFPVFSSPAQFQGKADAVIDFSSPAALEGLLAFGKATKTPLVLATTGYTPEQVAQIGAAALEVPIFRSANMSLGINVLLELVKKAAAVLGDSYDIEIVERHHRRKVDAPSGTALMIADAAASACGHETEYVFERHSVRQPRDKKEIGISAIRGGTIVGEHEIIFAGHDEVMEIKHTALSREIFAQGAVEAAKFMATVTAPGMYDMSMLVK